MLVQYYTNQYNITIYITSIITILTLKRKEQGVGGVCKEEEEDCNMQSKFGF